MTDAPGPTPALRRETYLACLCLLAFSFMLFQIAILRELRFQLTTLFTLTPFLFSAVIVCIALGSLCASRIRSKSRDVLRWAALALPIVLPLLFAATIAIAQGLLDPHSSRFQYGQTPAVGSGDSYLRSTIVAFVAVAVLGYGFVFFLQGLVFSLYFREGREEGILSDLYGADLVASGLGALAGGGLNFFMSPSQIVMVATGILLLNLWITFRHLGIKEALVLGASLLVGVLIASEFGWGLLSRLENPRWLPGRILSLWSRYRRIDVVDSPRQLMVFADGIIFQPYAKDDGSHEGDFRRLPVEVIRASSRPVKDVLIVGGGSGADVRVLRDLVGPDLKITAVELDQGFVDTARSIPWLWNYYRTAEIIVQEGRYFLENTTRDFDLVLYAFIDPQSAISSIGIPDANFLYTDAGLRAAFSHVREGGHLIVSRVYLDQEHESFLRRTCATLESAGIRPEHTRIYRLAGGIEWGYYGRLTNIHILSKKGGVPADLNRPGLIPLAWTTGERATTDLFPFSLGTGIWFDTLLGYFRRNAILLTVGLLVCLGLGGAAVTSASRFNLFVLGFGSFLLESLVLFNSFLLFGDPNLSAALAVGLFLLWNGVGSLLSEKVAANKWTLAVVPAAILLYALTAPFLSTHTIRFSASIRCLAFALHLAPAGVAAGMMFPLAIRRFTDKPVAWLFFMDVMGCAVAPPLFWLAMSTTGLWLVIAVSCASYAFVCGFLSLRART